MTPHDKFLSCEAFLRGWIKNIRSYTWRPEGTRLLPKTYDELVAAMAAEGWDDDRLIKRLNELTGGRFRSHSRDVMEGDEFDQILSEAILPAIFPGRLGRQILEIELKFDRAELTKRHRADVRVWEGEGHNTRESALAFANEAIKEANDPPFEPRLTRGRYVHPAKRKPGLTN